MTEERRKLLIHSNAPWAPTGYGNQVDIFGRRLLGDYNLAISAFYGLEGAPQPWNGIPVLPSLGGEFGDTYLLSHAKALWGEPRGGLLMLLMDVWVLKAALIAEMNACAWVPVDHDPAPPNVIKFFEESSAVPMAMSRFGQERLEQFDPLYVPHGVETEKFKPLKDRKAMREELGLPVDGFICAMNAANKGRPSRKGFQQAFEAFRHFQKKRPNAYLYLHTTMIPEWYGEAGENLSEMITSLEIPPESVKICDQYQHQFLPSTSEALAQMTGCWDVLLNPAMGEGFGIPIMEAQACGVPVIATNFSAMTETVGAGWKVGCRPHWTGQRSWQVIADVGEIIEALEAAYAMSSKQKEEMAKAAREHALQYDADKVYVEYLLPALREVQERVGEAPKMKASA